MGRLVKDYASAAQVAFGFFTGIKHGSLEDSFALLTEGYRASGWGDDPALFGKTHAYTTGINNVEYKYKRWRPRIITQAPVTPGTSVVPEAYEISQSSVRSRCIITYLEQHNELHHPTIDQLLAKHPSHHGSGAQELIGLFNEDLYNEGIVNKRMLEDAFPRDLFMPNGIEMYLRRMNADYSINDMFFSTVPTINEVTNIVSCIKTHETPWRIGNINAEVIVLK